MTNETTPDRIYRLLVQGVTDYAICFLDADGIVLNWNAGAQLAKGYAAEEIVGQSFGLFYSQAERERGVPRENLRLARETGHFAEEGWRHRKDGSRFWANVVIDPIYDEDYRLLGFAKITRDLTAQRETEHRLAHQAGHDALTGLSNRTTFFERLGGELGQVVRGDSLAVHYVDLDRFKPVNDAFGHQAGDDVLQMVASRLRALAGPRSLVARFGGDEFAVLQLGSPSLEAAEALGDRIVAALTEPFGVRHAVATLGASVGIAHAPTHGADAASLLRNADLALYRAKEEGRGRCRVFEAGMNARALSRGVMEIKLRQALRTSDFALAFQPIVEARSLRTTGFEALLRWRDQTGIDVSPAEFVPIAEDLGLMPELGEWVLRAACREAAIWEDEVAIAVNVSPTQLRDRNFVEVVKRALADTRLPPHRLEIEITEAAILADLDLAGEALQALRALGVRVALDDFGAGFSSLALVGQLPLTRIKIDRSFVGGLGATARSTSVVRAVLSLCEGYGLASTAEGVETAEQMTLLRRYGCESVQGVLLGRPMSASSAGAWIRDPAAACLAM